MNRLGWSGGSARSLIIKNLYAKFVNSLQLNIYTSKSLARKTSQCKIFIFYSVTRAALKAASALS